MRNSYFISCFGSRSGLRSGLRFGARFATRLAVMALMMGSLGHAGSALAEENVDSPAATETVSPTPTPEPAPGPAPSPTPEPAENTAATLPLCEQAFVNIYLRAANEVKTASTYINENQTPPNLAQAFNACMRLEAEYSDVTCRVGRAVPVSSTDLMPACTIIKGLFERTEEANGNNSENSTPSELEAALPVASLVPKNLTFEFIATEVVQNAVNKSKEVFFIKGQAYTLAESVVSNAPIRCTFFKPSRVEYQVTPGEVVRAGLVEETFLSRAHYTRIILDNQKAAIDCASSGGSAITLGQLKETFGELIKVIYTP